MPGFVGFINEMQINNWTADCFTQLAGQKVSQWQELGCQVQMNAQKTSIAHHNYSNDFFCVDIWGDVLSFDSSGFDDLFRIIEHALLSDEVASFAKKLNGYFVISVLDKRNNTLTLINDRYGMKPLYIWSKDSLLYGFASELKGIILHPKHQQQVDRSALETFIDVGHFLGLETLFTDVKRMPPATVLTVSLTSGLMTKQRYWQWSEIGIDKEIDFDHAIDKAYELFDQAIKRALATCENKQLAITLSGGLDSRVLLAAARQHFDGEIKTYTFGEQGCADALIAAQVADFAGVDNQFTPIDGQNWFDGREEGVWLTDGLKNVLHMHALSSVSSIATHSNYLLNGFLGDVTAGGSYLIANKAQTNLLDMATIRYGKHASKALFDPDYFEGSSSDGVFIFNRGMRFISVGSDLLSNHLNNFKPFMDNDFVDFLYSLPQEMRENGRLYHHMLLKYYPDFFAEIPWQQTGKPISLADSESYHAASGLKQQLKNIIRGSVVESVARRLYRKLSKKHHYVAYDDWLRRPQFKEYTRQLLLAEQAMLPTLLGRDKIELILQQFYSGKEDLKAETIGSLLTLEIYFKQLSLRKKTV
ncbi:hypothetical protein PULV_a3401 [Pseudoalteromonas ulvae UL12]|uniref:asparagine synthase (glutamine-hydrolyzing) n=1 Tax=Pseudoalteromonas ulvae TaxID=107327 RepID=A0A244CPV1_PSEDV|nr:asparagine synthase-related protein [Pseudoalteromonas ulvae]MBE0365088.1 hypothetical protein [Pseudoalteromonas ulvae UL12]OUL57641.1 hypothetical protein B1199_11285 [Pseudoalteromonas ulvae]